MNVKVMEQQAHENLEIEVSATSSTAQEDYRSAWP